MDLRVRKKLPHTVPQWVAEGSWFFITIKCLPLGKNQLCQGDGAHGVTRPTVGEGVLAAMAHNHDKHVWHCGLGLLMPDHLHAILAFPREPGMQTVISNWKKYVAVKPGVKWQRDFFDHRLRNDQELQAKTNYILMNPVRKELCEHAEDWTWVYRPGSRPPRQRG